MTNDELIARAEAALDGVTDGPWELRFFQSGTVQVVIREWADGSPDTRQGGSTYGYHSAYMSMHNIGTRDDVETDNEKYRNGKFIAEARDLVPDLIAALKASEARVKELNDAMRFIDAMVSWELNPSNYDHVDVCHLNADWIKVGNAAQEAVKGGTQ